MNCWAAEFYGNAFVCEPVHNMVYRLVLESERHRRSRAIARAEEQHSEFLASTDNWFRPVQVRTGPDGALWVVDMYRFVIEHPRAGFRRSVCRAGCASRADGDESIAYIQSQPAARLFLILRHFTEPKLASAMTPERHAA